MSQVKRAFLFIGRALFGLIFLMAGIKKIFYWHSIEENMVMKVCEWHLHLHQISFFDGAVYVVPLMLGVATFLEIVGSLMILFGFFFRMGAFFLLIFLVPTTLTYHNFWFQVGDKYTLELAMFLKNMALIGSLILFVVDPSFKKEKLS